MSTGFSTRIYDDMIWYGILDSLLHHFQSVYYRAKQMCIDEAMVLWHGRFVFRQQITGKCHKYGIKLYLLCESSGYVVNALVYCGKSRRHVRIQSLWSSCPEAYGEVYGCCPRTVCRQFLHQHSTYKGLAGTEGKCCVELFIEVSNGRGHPTT